MGLKANASRVRIPLIEAFRRAHERHDAKVRIDDRDESGERVIAGRRASARAIVSGADLQRNVAQDLEQLMNAVNLAADLDLSAFPHVRRSILNYGMADITHRSIEDAGVADIAREIEIALRAFEPRLVPGTITAKRDDAADPVALKLRFVVRAEIDSTPLNIPVEFVADLERDIGRIRVSKR